MQIQVFFGFLYLQYKYVVHGVVIQDLEYKILENISLLYYSHFWDYLDNYYLQNHFNKNQQQILLLLINYR